MTTRWIAVLLILCGVSSMYDGFPFQEEELFHQIRIEEDEEKGSPPADANHNSTGMPQWEMSVLSL
jgi:hypothetical protein